jgi:putative phosphoesterase
VYRYAVISDLHSDLVALKKSLAKIQDLGCNSIVCAGDLIDTGSHPDEVILMLRDLGIPCVRGNHDRWAISHGGKDDQGKVLLRETLEFLTVLPKSLRFYEEDVRVGLYHGSPGSDMEGIYPGLTSTTKIQRWLSTENLDVLIVGHTHLAFSLPLGRGQKVVNPGSLSGSSGTFGVLELPSKNFTIHPVD